MPSDEAVEAIRVSQNEARIYAKYILKEKPKARIAVVYQNDDYGKDISRA
jgi:branched-chain amino acid transport system substrate-binding protein